MPIAEVTQLVPLLEITLTTAIWLVVLAIILVVMIVSMLVMRARLNVWKLFARRHNFKIEQDGDFPRVTGSMGSRAFELSVRRESSSDSGVLGLELLRMAISLHGAPPKLVVDRASGMAGTSESDLDPEATSTGDAAFDTAFVVTVGGEGDLAALTSARREALLRLAEEYPECSILLESGQLALLNHSAGIRRGMLEDWCAGLKSAADAWDAG